MFWDDLRKLLSRPTLYRLDALIAPRLVPVFYAVGLAAIGLWAVDHLFASFEFNFGQGLWGILEILVFGPLWVLALRIACELVLVFCKAHEGSVAAVGRSRGRNTLLEDVRDAIHDLADADDDDFGDTIDPAPFSGGPGGGGAGGPRTAIDIDPPIKGTMPRRTKRTPPAST
jgi:hypothetical protein